MANNHRSWKRTSDKPWQLGRKLGKWTKCAICSGVEMFRDRVVKMHRKRRAANKVPITNDIRED